ncbi:MAG: hypothetical protein ACXVGC_10195 [Mycobacteriaceae bacterium]
MSRTTIETHTGLFYDYLDPKPEQVCIEDIAHALSMTSRFGGHCSRFYSVAEHCCLVRQLVIEAGRPELGLAALLHDAHEAYVGDIPTPLKHELDPSFLDIVADCDFTITSAIGHGLHPVNFHRMAIIEADHKCLRFEAAVLKVSRGTGSHWGYDWPSYRDKFIRCHDPQAAKWRFLRDFREETA